MRMMIRLSIVTTTCSPMVKHTRQRTTVSTVKTIDGKRYAFDEDGKMLYGWVNEDGHLANDDDDWETLPTTGFLGRWFHEDWLAEDYRMTR